MNLIQWPDTDAYFNLAVEEYIFNSLDRSQDYLLLWQNRNAIVVGVHQNTWEEINHEYVKEYGIQVVRRMTGGGAVYHDLGNLNYSFIVDSAEVDFNFKVLAQPVVQTLERLGVNVVFSGRNDLTIEGKKISGSAQMIKRKRLLHHGTLLFNSNLETLSAALKVKADKIESKGVKSVRSRVTNIQDHLPGLAMQVFKSMLVEEISRSSQVSEHTFTAEDKAAISKLREEKYSTWEWNYGKSPDYNIKKERRFDGGGLSIYMTVHKGTIQSIQIFGDFFGSGEIKELEDRLAMVEIREEPVHNALKDLDIGHYIHGLSNQEFTAMIIS